MSFAERLSELNTAIAAACRRAGRSPGDVHLLAVSKLQPPEAIEEAYALGVRDFGENYVQELAEKRARLAHLKDLRWHLIGHLQTNKMKQALSAADVFQALDSAKLAAEAAKRAAAAGLTRPWPVFIQVNLEAEPSKAGVSPTELAALAEMVWAQPSLRLQGLMCIPEPKETAEAMRPAFRELARLAREVSAQSNRAPLELSMGMSSDFEVAIEEGTTWVRVGTKLFGERPQKR